MKTVRLDTEITDLAGKQLTGGDGKPLTLRTVLVQEFGLMASERPEDSVAVLQLGLKLNGAENPVIELEDAEFTRAEQALATNPFRFVDVVRARAWKGLHEEG